MTKKKRSVVLLLSPLFVTALLLLFFLPRISPKSGPITTELSKNRKAEIEQSLLAFLQVNDPARSIQELKALSDNPSVARACHPFLHHIGKEAYKKYQNFADAMNYQDSYCNSGYVHGVIQQYFSDGQDIEAKVTETCRAETTAFSRWQCIHGVGHGVMYAEGNVLDESLKLCELLPNEADIKTCANGVFMEQFIVTDHSGHIREDTTKDTDISVCTSQKKTYQPTCLLYAPTAYLEKNSNDYPGAFRYCANDEELLVVYCASGVGSQAMKDQIAAPDRVAKICAQAEKDNYVAACISGASSLYVYQHESSKKAYELCKNEFKDYRTICEGSVWASANELNL